MFTPCLCGFSLGKDLQVVELFIHLKLPIDVNVSGNGCLSLLVLRQTSNLSRVHLSIILRQLGQTPATLNWISGRK